MRDCCMLMFLWMFVISAQVKKWFSVESEKHLAPLDSYNLTLSSIQDMRQNLAQFIQDATVSVPVLSLNRTRFWNIFLEPRANVIVSL